MSIKLKKLNDQVIVITGASSGTSVTDTTGFNNIGFAIRADESEHGHEVPAIALTAQQNGKKT